MDDAIHFKICGDWITEVAYPRRVKIRHRDIAWDHTNLGQGKGVKSDEAMGTHDSVYFGMDDGPLDRAQLRSAASWAWSMAAHNSKMSLICLQAFELTAGAHVLKLTPRKPMHIDLVAITDNPGLFD